MAKSQAGASAHTEYADGGDDQKVMMAPRTDCAGPSVFSAYMDELTDEEKAKAAAAIKKGLPLENYMSRARFRCANIKRCGFSSVDPNKVSVHEKTCSEVLKKREAEWLAANPGKPLEEKLVPLVGDAPEPYVIPEPPVLTEEKVVAIVRETVAPMLSEILLAIRGGQKETPPDEDSSALPRPASEDGPKPVGGLGQP